MSAPNSGCPPTALASFLPNRLSPPAAKSTHLRSWSPWLIQPGTTLYYTLDGSIPGANSILYTGPFTLTNSVAVNVVATKLGSVNSAVTTASFINSSAIGNGTGLLGQYWTNTTSTAFTNVAFAEFCTNNRTKCRGSTGDYYKPSHFANRARSCPLHHGLACPRAAGVNSNVKLSGAGRIQSALWEGIGLEQQAGYQLSRRLRYISRLIAHFPISVNIF